METSREDNSTPTLQQLILKRLAVSYSSLAQSVEHLTVNQGVVGSSPTGGAKTESTASAVLFVLLPLSALPQRLPILDILSPQATDGNVPRSLAMQFLELQGELAQLTSQSDGRCLIRESGKEDQKRARNGVQN